MSATPDSTFTNPEQLIADLQRQRDECKAERDECQAERDEALEQQTATAEVLQVINRSPGDLTPVFDAILEKAHALCDAPLGSLVLCDGEQLRAVATRGYPQEYDAIARRGFLPTPPFRWLLSGEPFVQVADFATPPAPDGEDHPTRRAAVEIAGVRTALFVPLRKDTAVLGYINAQRQEVRSFSDKQIALLQNFAAQAVIAMENARLLGELRERTGDLQESLEYQTATSDVLKVISQSGADLEAMLNTLVETATRLCEADKAMIYRLSDGLYRTAASFGFPPEYKTFIERNPITPTRGTLHLFATSGCLGSDASISLHARVRARSRISSDNRSRCLNGENFKLAKFPNSDRKTRRLAPREEIALGQALSGEGHPFSISGRRSGLGHRQKNSQ